MFKNLRAEMARHNVTIGDIAKALDVRYATVSDKLNGKYRFYYDEALSIKEIFFKDKSIEYLFCNDELQTGWGDYSLTRERRWIDESVN